LEAHRLVVRTIAGDGAASWSLVHDTLVPRIEAWFTVIDLERRRAAELVRFYLRQSQDDAVAMLNARQLRALTKYPGLIEQLEAEWSRRPATVWTPKLLVARSRQALRSRRAIAGAVALAVVAITALLVVRWLDERTVRRTQERLRELNLGRFDLVLAAFDCREGTKRSVDIGELPGFDWELHDASNDDPQAPGNRVDAPRLVRGVRAASTDGTFVEVGIQARGGGGFLRVMHRGRDGESCGPSVVPLRHLPGYGDAATPRLRIEVPTCRATRDGTIAIPAGPFVWGGHGEPPARFAPDDVPKEAVVVLPAYAIDRTEITNAAFAVFAEMSGLHDVVATQPPDFLKIAGGGNFARADLDWYEARAYCRYLGKELPTSMQWQKALRGGMILPDGTANPHPRRNVPWGDAIDPAAPARRAAIAPPGASAERGRAYDPRRPSPVAAFPDDVSPYGVADLAGGLQEWTNDFDDVAGVESVRPRLTRGGNWYDTEPDTLNDYMAIQNPRMPRMRFWYLGARCVTTE
ncbi:MAG TPA: SUMF1/EgtB/PvdO family nonheme iron enzyme, partial [Kofleriaceae bacterium]